VIGCIAVDKCSKVPQQVRKLNVMEKPGPPDFEEIKRDIGSINKSHHSQFISIDQTAVLHQDTGASSQL
jgi:hypothetical protein